MSAYIIPVLCSYRAVRDTFIPVCTTHIKLTALTQRFSQYAYIAFGRITPRPGKENIDYDALHDIFDNFHPSKDTTASIPNGIIPANIKGKNYDIYYYKMTSVPGALSDLPNIAVTICGAMPNCDAIVIQTDSTTALDWLKELLNKELDSKAWSGEWVFVLDAEETPQEQNEGTTQSGNETAEQKSNDALERLKFIGKGWKEVRKDTELVVQLSNTPVIEKADNLKRAEFWKQVGACKVDGYPVIGVPIKLQKTEHVMVVRLKNNKYSVSVVKEWS